MTTPMISTSSVRVSNRMARCLRLLLSGRSSTVVGSMPCTRLSTTSSAMRAATPESLSARCAERYARRIGRRSRRSTGSSAAASCGSRRPSPASCGSSTAWARRRPRRALRRRRPGFRAERALTRYALPVRMRIATSLTVCRYWGRKRERSPSRRQRSARIRRSSTSSRPARRPTLELPPLLRSVSPCLDANRVRFDDGLRKTSGNGSLTPSGRPSAPPVRARRRCSRCCADWMMSPRAASCSSHPPARPASSSKPGPG